MLFDGDVNPTVLKKSAHHKRWESTVSFINPSLPKALRANNFLSGNNPSEGWGSQYSENPRSFSLFLPKSPLKFCPQVQEFPLAEGPQLV